jgi:hypothetical protein
VDWLVILNRNQGGVIASRFLGSLKKANTSRLGRLMICVASSRWVFDVSLVINMASGSYRKMPQQAGAHEREGEEKPPPAAAGKLNYLRRLFRKNEAVLLSEESSVAMRFIVFMSDHLPACLPFCLTYVQDNTLTKIECQGFVHDKACTNVDKSL